MEYFWRGGQDIAELRRRLTTANAEPNEPHDQDSLQNVLPLLSRVYSVMKHIQGMIPEEGDDPFLGFYRGRVDACEYEDMTVKGSRCMCEGPGLPGHFTWEQLQRLHKPAIVPWEFEKTGNPICYAGEPKPGGHERSWGGNADLAASFWPNIIPHLKAQYLIDRRIMLRPGARIPPGARTFRGNGSLVVEVPFPANRELERGGQDDVRVYPEAGEMGGNTFDLARHVREMMMKRSRLPRIPEPVYYAFIPQQPEQTSLSVAVPETRVLTIIE
ncbi:hypothetical protein VTJ04DRAFT_7310 [Mycothermus thermophilus]|uniref:uncharacterized protein n=1 Tax=Humicola insolens TaxID=85995 RepID=UPI0037436513